MVVINLARCAMSVVFERTVCMLVFLFCLGLTVGSHVVTDDAHPTFPPKSSESPYPRLLHERDVIRYQDAEGRYVTLGSGAYANVTLGELAGSGVHVVIKAFRDSPFREILKEIRLHRYAEYLGVAPRLIGLLPSGPLAGNISLVYEYIAFSATLDDWLDNYNLLSTVQWVYVCRQITLIILRLHQHEVLFNDLHRGNVLIHKQTNEIKVSLIDFGFATYKGGMFYSHSNRNLSGYNFIAPELANISYSTNETDIFSLGYIFNKIYININVSPLRLLALWCMADEPSNRPKLLTIIAKLDIILFKISIISRKGVHDDDLQKIDLEKATSAKDYLILTKEKRAVVSVHYLFCPVIFTPNFIYEETTRQWAWLIQSRRILFEKCRVPLFVLDEHDLVRQHAADIEWLSAGKYDAIRIAKLQLTNQTVIVKEFYKTPFEIIREETCATAVLGELSISPRIIGILIEYKKMNDIAFVQEFYGSGVTLEEFIFITSGHEWDLTFLKRAAKGEIKHKSHNISYVIQNETPWNALRVFSELVNELTVRTCQKKSNRRLIMEQISIRLVKKLMVVHDSGYLINNCRADNILIQLDKSNTSNVDIDIRIIDLGQTSSVENGLYFKKSAKNHNRFSYLAPEVLDGDKTSRSSDIYSLCFALYQLMSDYFTTLAPRLSPIKHSQNVTHFCSVYSKCTLEESTHALRSKVMKSSLPVSEPRDSDNAMLRYQHLLLECLYSRPPDRPPIKNLLHVSSVAFA